jgi:sugar lactone lactonase YvrE
MNAKSCLPMVVAIATVALALPNAAAARTPETRPVVHELTSFAAPGCVSGCGSGSAIGPDRALYVTDGPGGRVLRVNPRTGATTTYARGLPPALPDVGIGGAIDVAFLGHTAYVLVTLVGSAFGQPDVVNGIYRVEKNGTATAIADLGAWSIAHPPGTDIFIPSGVQYALQPFRGGLLVTDGHHNRVLRVSRHGQIRELAAFGNVVPTGLAVHGRTILMGEAGPIPHLPDDGRITRLEPRSSATRIASGASLIVDVEFGLHRALYALSQGVWNLPPTPENEGKPAAPNTGQLLRVRWDGGLAPVVAGLDRPTSLEFVDDRAFVVTLTGKVLRLSHLHGAA